jgi:hypothetical protein
MSEVPPATKSAISTRDPRGSTFDKPLYFVVSGPNVSVMQAPIDFEVLIRDFSPRCQPPTYAQLLYSDRNV